MPRRLPLDDAAGAAAEPGAAAAGRGGDGGDRPSLRRPAPALEASFDTLPCLTAVEHRGPHHFTLRITPPGGPAPCRLLRLQALTGGSPAEDGVSGDDRVLSVAVTGVTFDYAAERRQLTAPR